MNERDRYYPCATDYSSANRLLSVALDFLTEKTHRCGAFFTLLSVANRPYFYPMASHLFEMPSNGGSIQAVPRDLTEGNPCQNPIIH
jgi:hypothetical protein